MLVKLQSIQNEAASERKAAEKELETAHSEQLRRSEGASLPVPIKSGVFPKDLEAAGLSTGRKAGKLKRKARKANGSKNPAPKNEPDAVYSGAFEGKGKSRLKKKDNSHPSAHHPSEIVVSVKTGTATKEDLLAVTKALIEAKLSQQGPVDGAPRPRFGKHLSRKVKWWLKFGIRHPRTLPSRLSIRAVSTKLWHRKVVSGWLSQ